MSFGNPATSSQYVPLNNLSRLQLIFVSVEALKKLNWTITQLDENGL